MEKKLMKLIEVKDTELYDLDLSRDLWQTNDLVDSCYYLPLTEQKLVYLVISQVRTEHDSSMKIALPFDDVADAIGMSTDRYSTIKPLVESIAKRTLKINKKSGWRITHWFQAIEYNKDSGLLIFELDQQIEPEILNLKEKFLQQKIEPLLQYKGQYSARFYLLIRNVLKIGHRIIGFDEIRLKFGLMEKKSYRLATNLKNWVIIPALDEIKEKSDLNFDYSWIKQGRRSVGVYIENIKLKAADKGTIIEESKDKLVTEMSAAPWYLTEETIASLMKRYGRDHLEANLDYATRYMDGKDHPAGWLISCIQQNHGQGERDALAKRNARIENREKVQRDMIKEDQMQLFGLNADDVDERPKTRDEQLTTLFAKLGEVKNE